MPPQLDLPDSGPVTLQRVDDGAGHIQLPSPPANREWWGGGVVTKERVPWKGVRRGRGGVRTNGMPTGAGGGGLRALQQTKNAKTTVAYGLVDQDYTIPPNMKQVPPPRHQIRLGPPQTVCVCH